MPHPVPISEDKRPTVAQLRKNTLWHGSIWSLATVASVSLGGFAFWVLAAATTPASEAVGIATAWFTLVQLGVTGTAIGLPILITRHGSEPDASKIAGAGVLAVSLIGLSVGLGSPSLAAEGWSTLAGRGSFSLAPIVAVVVVGSSLTLGVDARLMSLRRWRLVFVRSTIPVAVRLPLLLIDPLIDRAAWIALVAVGPIAASGYLSAAWLLLRREIIVTLPSKIDAAQRHFFATQHLGALATQAPYYIVPFLVSRQIPGSLNAPFYLIWGVGLMAALVPQTLTQVLLSETSLDPAGRVSRLRTTLAANVSIGIGAWLGSLVLARPILELVGPTYSAQAEILPWLLLAALCWGVTSVCLTEARLIRDARTTNLVTWTLAASTIIGCLVILPSRPIWGATIVWLVANVAAMTVAIAALDRKRSYTIGAPA